MLLGYPITQMTSTNIPPRRMLDKVARMCLGLNVLMLYNRPKTLENEIVEGYSILDSMNTSQV